METALSLIQSAFALLALLNGFNQPIPEELRIQALVVANHAVEVAQAEIARINEESDEDNDELPASNDEEMNDTTTSPTDPLTASEPTPQPAAPANAVTLNVTADRTSVPVYSTSGYDYDNDPSQITFTIHVTSSETPIKQLPFEFLQAGSPYNKNSIETWALERISPNEYRFKVVAYPPKDFVGTWNVPVRFGDTTETVTINVGQ